MRLQRKQAESVQVPVLAADLRALFSKLKRRLREQTMGEDLTPSQASALVRLEREGAMTVTVLANAEGVRVQSMGVTIARLETAGLVSGSPDPTDGRKTLLSVTPDCRRWIEEGRSARQDWLVRALQRELSNEELRDLASAVELLKRVADA